MGKPMALFHGEGVAARDSGKGTTSVATPPTARQILVNERRGRYELRLLHHYW